MAEPTADQVAYVMSVVSEAVGCAVGLKHPGQSWAQAERQCHDLVRQTVAGVIGNRRSLAVGEAELELLLAAGLRRALEVLE